MLTEPRDYFKEPFGGEVAVPVGSDAAGIGEDPIKEGRTHEREQADEIEELERVRLEEATPLKELRQAV